MVDIQVIVFLLRGIITTLGGGGEGADLLLRHILDDLV